MKKVRLKLGPLIVLLAFSLTVLILSEKQIGAQEIIINPVPVQNGLPPHLSWTFLEKLEEKEGELVNLPLKSGTKALDFYETRVSVNSAGKMSTTRKKLKEEEKDIGLKILNTQTGEVQIITVSLKINNGLLNLISPNGYTIEIVERSSGIKWNKWNTAYKITGPENWVVLKNKFPHVEDEIQKVTVKDKNGKKRVVNRTLKVVKYFIYSPYSDDLHQPELVQAGMDHLKKVVATALQDLREKNVYSRAMPGELVANVSALTPSFFEHLPLVEHMDFTEFTDNSQRSAERVLVLIGSNNYSAYYKTGSKAGALGWVQYTSPTYNTIRKTYPAAKLDPVFVSGAAEHINSMKAAILLHDYNLDTLIKKHGQKILNDPRLEEYLAGMYNGKPSRVSSSLKASTRANLSDWINSLSSIRGGLKEETKGYMLKIRYLVENRIP